MKTFIKTLIISLLSISTFAQQSSEIDPKFVKLPRYADLTAINAAILTPTQGMMVYNIGTASNWYYNGTSWTNMAVSGSLTLPYSQTQTNASTLFSLTNLGTGGAGYFRINYSLNSNNALEATTFGSGSAIYGSATGTSGYAATFESVNSLSTLKSTNYDNGNAGRFEINNTNSSGHTLLVNTNGLGRSGWFQSTNPLNNAASLIGENYGLGQGVYGTNFGTGKAGVFEINNSLNTNIALHAFTNGDGDSFYSYTGGLGRAGVFEINNSSNANIALHSVTNGLGRAGNFSINNAFNSESAIQVSTNGTGRAGLFLIFNSSNSNSALETSTMGTGRAASFSINNISNSNTALTAFTNGTGTAASFGISNASNTYPTLTTNTYGSGKALWATNLGTGNAGFINIDNIASAATALEVNTNGIGKAASFTIFDASNSSNAIYATTNGTGSAASFYGSKALETFGAISFGGSGVGTPSVGRVLTATDALGNATWQAIPAVAAPLNLTSTATTFSSTATGASGYAGSFQNTHTSNPNPALEGVTFGPSNGVRGISYNGVAGLFSNSNYNVIGGNSALIGHSNSNGYKSIYGISEGNNGQAGVFQIQNGTNTNAALESSTNGPGKAAYFHGINALETDGTIKFGGSGVGTIAAGKVLTATDGLGNATWQAIPAVTAPLNLTSPATTLQSIATGASGFAGDFQITNASNAANALSSTTTGTGKAAYFQGTNALETNGTIKFGGSGVGTPAAGKVLTATDALGNATWQNPNLILPYSQTNNTFSVSNSQFEIIHNGPGSYIANNLNANSAIKGTYSGVMGNLQGSGIFGVFSGTGSNVNSVSSSGILGIGINSASGVIGLSSGTGTGVSGSSQGGIGGSFSSTSGYALITGTGNVGIGTNTPTAKLDVAGYTKLGDDATAPKIKMKELAIFNSAATYNGQSPQAHGLTASKIISVSVLLEWTAGYFVPVEYSSDVNLRYNYFISPTEIIVQNNTPGPTCPYICGKPVKVLITYKE